MLMQELDQLVPVLMEQFIGLVPVQMRHAQPTEKRPWLPSVSRERSESSIQVVELVDEASAEDD